jgi:hypothetical protein
MSRAIAVFHGRFGRASTPMLNRPLAIHAHRERRLIFCIDALHGWTSESAVFVTARRPALIGSAEWARMCPHPLRGGA